MIIWEPILKNRTAMKTTIEVSDALMIEAKTLAQAHNTTLRALIEQGLEKVVRDLRQPKVFKLEDGSVSGRWGCSLAKRHLHGTKSGIWFMKAVVRDCGGCQHSDLCTSNGVTVLQSSFSTFA